MMERGRLGRSCRIEHLYFGVFHNCEKPFGWIAITLFLLAMTACQPAASDPKPSKSRSAGSESSSRASRPQSPPLAHWPLFRGNAQATGVASSDLPEDLELLWTFSSEEGGFEATAAIVDGVVYVGCTDGKLYAINLATGKKRWAYGTTLGFSTSAAVRDGLVYLGDTDGRFHCVNAATGKSKWRFDAEAEINSSANFHGCHVLFGSQDTRLYCLDAASGELAWTYESPDQIRCFPTVFGSTVLVAGCDGHLHIIDLRRGVELGQVAIHSPTGSSPAILDAMAFVGTEGGQFFAIDLRLALEAAAKKQAASGGLSQVSSDKNGTVPSPTADASGSETKDSVGPGNAILWQFRNPEHGASFRSSAAVTPQAVIIGSRDKQLRAFDPKTGNPLWSFLAKGRIDSSPVVVGQRVFVGSADGRVHAIDVNTGKAVWQFEAGGAVVASPAVAEGCLVIGNDSGTLYCFGAKSDRERGASERSR